MLTMLMNGWNLDPRSMLLVSILSAASLGAVALSVDNTSQPAAAIHRYGHSLLLASLSWALLALRGTLPDVVTYSLAIWLLLAAMVVGLSALQLGYEVPVNLPFFAGLTVLGLLAYAYYFYLRPDHRWRTLVFTLVTLMIFVQYLRMCLTAWAQHRGRPLGVLVGLTSVFLLIVAARLVIYAAWPPSDADYLQPSWPNALMSVAGMAFTVGGALAFILTQVRRLQDEVSHIAERDELTQLLNRRGFVQHAGPLMAESAARGEQVALVMFDLDHFKALNDNHGHDTGDRLLVEVSRIIGTHVRRDDLVARMGGEEFVALMPNITTDEALEIAHRVRLALVRVNVDDAEGVPVFCTTSAGIALAEAGSATWESLYSRADRALYQAKAAGRNRCMVWSTVTQITSRPPEFVI